MIDPRLKDVLEYADELDADGNPSTRAKIALKIKAYALEVDDLRAELTNFEQEVGELQATVNALTLAVEEQETRKVDLVTEAQDAAVRAAMSGSGGASARLRKVAKETRDRITEFERDFEADVSRLANAKVSLESKKQAVKAQRDSIVRRLNTMSSLAERAGEEFGPDTSAAAQTSSSQQGQPRRMSVPRSPGQPMARRRPRRVRVRRRRAS